MARGRAGLWGSRAGLPLLAMFFWLGPDHGLATDLEQMKNSTVRIVCSANGSYYTGSGFVVGMDTPTTYVATNHHVAECSGKDDGQELFIVQSQRKGVPARIVWSDARADLAIISTQGSLGRPTVTLADTSTLAAGASVTVIGFPAAADKLVQSGEIASPSVTRGNISLVVKGLNGVRYFEYTAVTVPGNSGGPAFDDAGNVIGVVSMNAVAMISSVAAGRVAMSQYNTGLSAAVDVSELAPHLGRLGFPMQALRR